jgi:hypothetical protein
MCIYNSQFKYLNEPIFFAIFRAKHMPSYLHRSDQNIELDHINALELPHSLTCLFAGLDIHNEHKCGSTIFFTVMVPWWCHSSPGRTLWRYLCRLRTYSVLRRWHLGEIWTIYGSILFSIFHFTLTRVILMFDELA